MHGVVPPRHGFEQVEAVTEQVDEDRQRAQQVGHRVESQLRAPAPCPRPEQRQGAQTERVDDGPYAEALALQPAQVGVDDGQHQQDKGGDLDRRPGGGEARSESHASSVRSTSPAIIRPRDDVDSSRGAMGGDRRSGKVDLVSTVAEHSVRTPRRQILLWSAGTVVSLVGLMLAAFCYFMASLMTWGLYSWQTPQLDPGIVLPLIGVAVTLPLGPLVLARGAHGRRWLRVAVGAALVGVVLTSLTTWVPVAVGAA